METKGGTTWSSGMRAQEFINRQLGEDIENFPIANVRRPNGAIGNQGVNTGQAADVLTHAAGMQVSPDWTMRQMVDALKADPAAQQRLRQFVQQNPVTVYALPDGSYHLQDGHHRTFLLNLLGDETVPAVVKEDVTEAKTVEFEGLTLKVIKQGHELVVDALDDWGNKVLGHVKFNIGDGKELDPQDLEVDEKYQGQGIARVMYDYVKSLGYTINRSWDQTDAGAGFWNKHRGEDVRVWEQGMAENFADGKNPGTAAALQNIHKDTINEKINRDIRNRRFEHTQRIGDYTYKATVEIFMGDPLLWIKAYHGNKEIGHILFELYSDHLQSGGTEVDPNYRNKGVASTMYAYAKMLGNDIKPSYNRTDQGKNMWTAWEKSGDAKHLGPEVKENFADGKNPGRKGLAKRSGVNTKASVSDLRKTAKNSSGEKQRMAHWLANMKAGRAKAKRK